MDMRLSMVAFTDGRPPTVDVGRRTAQRSAIAFRNGIGSVRKDHIGWGLIPFLDHVDPEGVIFEDSIVEVPVLELRTAAAVIRLLHDGHRVVDARER
jgi:hypothetical protein